MADEVQTGMGRCGTLLASERLGFCRDVVTLAKGIAGGIPMGACLFRGKADKVFSSGDHQSTFAGNPLACSAGRIVLKTLSAPGFLDDVNRKGDYMRNVISGWKIPIVTDVRGLGLMMGTEIAGTIKPFDVEKRCLEKGLCVSIAGANVIRFLPPLTITDEEMDAGLAIFRSVLEEYV